MKQAIGSIDYGPRRILVLFQMVDNDLLKNFEKKLRVSLWTDCNLKSRACF